MAAHRKPRSPWNEWDGLEWDGQPRPEQRDATPLSFLPIKMSAEHMYTASNCVPQFTTSIVLISSPQIAKLHAEDITNLEDNLYSKLAVKGLRKENMLLFPLISNMVPICSGEKDRKSVCINKSGL